MRTLVISDIHHKIHVADRIMENEKWEHCIMLGDYQDDFGDNPAIAERTAIWMRDKIWMSDKILRDDISMLCGNHDLAYMYGGSSWTNCSGWSKEKSLAINGILSPADWDKLEPFVYHQGWLMSHAGFHPYFTNSKDPAQALINIEADKAGFRQSLKSGQFHPWLSVSWIRGGVNRLGGPFWCDQQEFTPIKGLGQIYGHTPLKSPKIYKFPDKSIGYVNLDTHMRHYGIIDNGILEIVSTNPDWFKP